MKGILFIVFILSFSNFVFGQKKGVNSLQFPYLIINDLVPIETSFFKGFNYASEFQNQAFSEFDFNKNTNLKSLFLKKLTEPGFVVYQDFSPYQEVYSDKYDELFVSKTKVEVKEILGEKSDTIVQVGSSGDLEKIVQHIAPDTNEIMGIAFFDKWHFDEKNFRLIKKTLAYCPVRRYDSGRSEEEHRWYYRKTAYFVFSELKTRKQEKISTKMTHLGRVAYEFSIVNKQLFGHADDEAAMYAEELESPNWNSYARKKLVKLLLDRVLSGESKAYDFDTKKELSRDILLLNLGHRVVEATVFDPETGEERVESYESEIIKEEIKSVVFIEDWYIDRESMRLYKKVIGAAPVRFYDDEDYTQKLKKVAFLVYF